MATVAATTALTAPAAGASPTPPLSAKIRRRYPTAFAKPTRVSPAPSSRRARFPARRSGPNASFRVTSGERSDPRAPGAGDDREHRFFSGGSTDALSLSLYDSHEGPHRGGAGKGGWGKPGDEAKAPQESNDDGADAPRRARGARQRGDHRRLREGEGCQEGCPRRLLRQEGRVLRQDGRRLRLRVHDPRGQVRRLHDEFALANGGAKAKRDRERTKSEKKIVDTGFRTAPTQDADDRPARGGRGGRGGRGDRDGGRGRGGRGGDRPARAPGGGRRLLGEDDDSAAFPTLA